MEVGIAKSQESFARIVRQWRCHPHLQIAPSPAKEFERRLWLIHFVEEDHEVRFLAVSGTVGQIDPGRGVAFFFLEVVADGADDPPWPAGVPENGTDLHQDKRHYP